MLTSSVYAMSLNRKKEIFCKMQDYGNKTLFRMKFNLDVSILVMHNYSIYQNPLSLKKLKINILTNKYSCCSHKCGRL